MPSHQWLDYIGISSNTATSNLCFLDDSIGTTSDAHALGSRVRTPGHSCDCVELCFCDRLDVLNEQALSMIEEGEEILGGGK